MSRIIPSVYKLDPKYTEDTEIATPHNTVAGDVVIQNGETFEVQTVYSERNVKWNSLFMVKRRRRTGGSWGASFQISWRVYTRFGNKTIPVFPLKKGRKA